MSHLVSGVCAGYLAMDFFYSEISPVAEKLFKVIVVGDPTVGKTSFVQRYVQNSYKKDYKGTVGVDFALKVVKWSETQNVKLQLWDVAGKKCPSLTFKLVSQLKLNTYILWVLSSFE